ncbi:MAG: DUF1573 domain-containing protein [Crocinitomix sp.]|nr:DUF1573 domain-containing protein [Crocinitomix sp.]
MKKFIGAVFLFTLVACGGDSDTKTNDGVSSLVADENLIGTTPEGGSEFEEITSDPLSPGSTSIEYIETTHNFGNVRYPSENLYTFKFKNTGNVPLLIESATASCGCTVPNKPEEAILPGEIGELDVIFRPKEGQQGQVVKKRVTVTANTEPKQSYLEITGNVLAPILD